MTHQRVLIHGDFISTPELGDMVAHEDAYVSIEDGRITRISDQCPDVGPDVTFIDHKGKLIIPGFADTHLHAVQYVTRGLGYDMELLPWLEDYTFPEEARFHDPQYAKRVFHDVVKDLWAAGTLHSAIYSSINTDASLMLMDCFATAGISAFVGKVNMDRNGGENLEETTEESIRETIRFIESAQAYAQKKVWPILTPRFAPSCSNELLKRLGDLSKEYDLPVQSHVNENMGEVAWVKELFPQSKNYLSVYEDFGLLPKGRAIMAHCIHNSKEEIDLFREKDVLIAHNPDSNANLASGIMPAGAMLDAGLRIGLGSDIGGGNRLFIGHAIDSVIKQSRLLWALTDHAHRTISFAEAFHMATAGGGSFFGQTGAFLPGYSFDALVIDDQRFTRYRPYTIFERLQKFVFVGDDRDIAFRYMAGEVVPEPAAAK
ncbi:MAG TPA: amidohydrolase family protein [Clostridia bacterium]|nr:amidohydrolase family protein [Clostridia bacterium]